MSNKYSAQGCWYSPETNTNCHKDLPGAIYFGSQWELRIYRKLRNYFHPEQIQRQRKILLKPKTVMFPAINWSCDFAIGGNLFSQQINELYIEAKGLPTKQFIRDMKFLEWQQPLVFARVRIVVADIPDKPGKLPFRTLQGLGDEIALALGDNILF